MEYDVGMTANPLSSPPLGIFAAFLFILSNTFATQHVRVIYLSTEALVKHADLIADVRIEKVEAKVLNNMVYTDAYCTVNHTIKGTTNEKSIIVRQAGGRTPTLVTDSGPNPNFEIGQKWILCLSKTSQNKLTVVGIKQGAFHIKNGKAIRDFSYFHFDKAPPISVKNNMEFLDEKQVRRELLEYSERTELEAYEKKKISEEPEAQKSTDPGKIKPSPLKLSPKNNKDSEDSSEELTNEAQPNNESPTWLRVLGIALVIFILILVFGNRKR